MLSLRGKHTLSMYGGCHPIFDAELNRLFVTRVDSTCYGLRFRIRHPLSSRCSSILVGPSLKRSSEATQAGGTISMSKTCGCARTSAPRHAQSQSKQRELLLQRATHLLGRCATILSQTSLCNTRERSKILVGIHLTLAGTRERSRRSAPSRASAHRPRSARVYGKHNAYAARASRVPSFRPRGRGCPPLAPHAVSRALNAMCHHSHPVAQSGVAGRLQTPRAPVVSSRARHAPSACGNVEMLLMNTTSSVL
jgi:hypothetical protein